MASQMKAPFQITRDGFIDATVDVAEKVEMGLSSAINTRYGERMMTGGLGSRVPDLVFDPLGLSFEVDPQSFIQREVTRVVYALYDGVTIVSIEVIESNQQVGEYDVKVNYSLGQDNVYVTATFTVNPDLLQGS